MHARDAGLVLAAAVPAGLAAPLAARLLSEGETALPWARETVVALLLLLVLGTSLFLWGAILLQGRRG